MQKDYNPYWDDATEIARKQRAKGIAEYGQTIEDNNAIKTSELLDMALEELVDAIYYVEHVKNRMNKLIERLNNESNK